MQMDVIKGQISTFKEVKANWEGNIHIHTSKYKTGYNPGLDRSAAGVQRNMGSS